MSFACRRRIATYSELNEMTSNMKLSVQDKHSVIEQLSMSEAYPIENSTPKYTKMRDLAKKYKDLQRKSDGGSKSGCNVALPARNISRLPQDTYLIAAKPSLDGIPVEVREKIFGYLLSAKVVISGPVTYEQETVPIKSVDDKGQGLLQPAILLQDKGVINPAILRVCQKFHSEGISLLYKNKTFQLNYRIAGAQSISKHFSSPATFMAGCLNRSLAKALKEFPYLRHVKSWSMDFVYYSDLQTPNETRTRLLNSISRGNEPSDSIGNFWLQWTSHIKKDVKTLQSLGHLKDVNVPTRSMTVYPFSNTQFFLDTSLAQLQALRADFCGIRVHSPILNPSHQYDQSLTTISKLQKIIAGETQPGQLEFAVNYVHTFYNRFFKVSGYQVSVSGMKHAIQPIPGHALLAMVGNTNLMNNFLGIFTGAARLLTQAANFYTFSRVQTSIKSITPYMQSILRLLKDDYVDLLAHIGHEDSWCRTSKGWTLSIKGHPTAEWAVEQLNEIESIAREIPKLGEWAKQSQFAM